MDNYRQIQEAYTECILGEGVQIRLVLTNVDSTQHKAIDNILKDNGIKPNWKRSKTGFTPNDTKTTMTFGKKQWDAVSPKLKKYNKYLKTEK